MNFIYLYIFEKKRKYKSIKIGSTFEKNAKNVTTQKNT